MQSKIPFYTKTNDYIYSSRGNLAATILDTSVIRTYHMHHVVLCICFLELQYSNLGLLSLALGKEPLEKDWIQGWIQPMDQKG